MSWRMTATELVEAFAEGTLSPVETIQSVFDRADDVNPSINALFDLRYEGSLAAAKASEARWRTGQPVGPLDGVPVLIKDSVAEAGHPYWRGTKARVGSPFPAEDSPPVARLKEAGAILFAKTTMPDFGLLASGISSAHGVTRNPWNLAMNTGGSSSGAGAAIASGIGPLAIGTDLGGSVRLPAAQNGLFAMKPGRGVVPHLPYSEARVAGPMTRTVADAALMLSVLAQPDSRASEPGALLPASVAPFPVKGLKIGLLTSMGFGPTVEPEMQKLVSNAARALEAEGADILPLVAPFDTDVFACLDTYFSVKAAIERDELPEGKRHETLDFITRYCDGGDAVTAKVYLNTIAAIERARERYLAVINTCDFVLSPVLPMVGFAADVAGPDPDQTSAHVSFAAMANQTGLPAVSIFCGFSEQGLPVGMHIVAGHGQEAALLGLSSTYEAMRPNPGFPPAFE
ncbi:MULTISPECIES: amidase [Roseobacteraceae]|uniref:Acylamidase n=2 Tax=Rhodobacterales TaxID=204455 RepID=A0A221K824_9RHOB|nr:acylamidase [Pseudosulfitobacter pseudonitzschiae]